MNFKLALAAAAVVGLAGTAQAADLAKKAPAAANYVKICDAYGAGYFYIPGTDTCLKIGGYVRAELRTGNAGAMYYNNGAGLGGTAAFNSVGKDINQSQRGMHAVNTRARVNLNFDARTATEMGLLRSYIELWMTNSSAGRGTGTTGLDINLRQAFVQFGGLTAGRATSFFDFVEGGYNIGNIEPDSADQRKNLFGYTYAFGNGISASLAVEDQSTSEGGVTTYANNGYGYSYQGVKYPDLVANVNITQAWGRAQVMAALHSVYGASSAMAALGPVAAVPGSVTSDKWGYAVGAGVEVNLPMLGAGDKVFLEGVYTQGAVGYAIVNGISVTPLATAYNFTADVNADAAGAAKLTTAWSITGGLNHNFSKAFEANLGASYAKVDNGGVVADYDVAQYIIGGDLRWKPVNGLVIGVAVDYRGIDFSSAANAAGFKDNGSWLGTLRVQRTF